jgi:hypothetical protein
MFGRAKENYPTEFFFLEPAIYKQAIKKLSIRSMFCFQQVRLMGCLFELPDSFWTLEVGSPNKHQTSWYSFEGITSWPKLVSHEKPEAWKT